MKRQKDEVRRSKMGREEELQEDKKERGGRGIISGRCR
jgi:hypothetical protein